ncbi:hypothetical protein [Nocardia sp. NPDC050793]|uniref:hypothetical protein n=1 Tax=Nocardia sp. NPDC050793 TaxID=3155159 RepID=UPI00340C20C6
MYEENDSRILQLVAVTAASVYLLILTAMAWRHIFDLPFSLYTFAFVGSVRVFTAINNHR